MDRTYYVGNRRRFYDMMETESLAAIFAGEELWKTGDEYYPFFADRNFVYLTGLKCKSAVLLAAKRRTDKFRNGFICCRRMHRRSVGREFARNRMKRRKNQALRIFVF